MGQDDGKLYNAATYGLPSMNKYYIYAMAAPLIWGTMGIFVRMVNLPGHAVYFFVALIMLVIMTAWLIAEGKLLPFFKKKNLRLPLSMGFFALMTNITYFWAFNLTTIASATLVHYIAPVLVMLFAPLILHETVGKKTWLPLGLGLAGLSIMLQPGSATIPSGQILGFILAFVSAITYALTTIYNRLTLHAGFEWKELVFSQMFVSVVLLLPFILYSPPTLTSSMIFPILTMSMVHQGIAVIFILKALDKIKAQTVAIISYLEHLSAVIFAGLFLGEVPATYVFIGGAVILASSYISVRSASSS